MSWLLAFVVNIHANRSRKKIVINSKAPTTLPVNVPTSIEHILSGYVEVCQPATTRDLLALEKGAKTDATLSALTKLREDYQESVLSMRLSVLDILEDYPDIELPLASFLQLMPPMRVRQYSISSSPLASPERATLTVSIIDAPEVSGSNKRFLGVASTFLANLKPGTLLPVVVRPSAAVFHLPVDPTVPVMMFCAGSGFAPFRGFIQERAAQREAGREVGKMLLFFGCRSPDDDYLYSDSDLAVWKEKGVVDVRPAFSRKADASEGCKYVQDRAWHDKDDIVALYKSGAKFYTCGSRKASNGVKQACVDMIKAIHEGKTDSEAAAEFERVQRGRFASDIFD